MEEDNSPESNEEQRNTGKLFRMYRTAIQNFCLSGNSVDHEVLEFCRS